MHEAATNAPGTPDHVRAVHAMQDELIRKMSSKRRLEIAGELYKTAWQLTQSGLRARHAGWTEEQITRAARRIFLTGHAGA